MRIGKAILKVSHLGVQKVVSVVTVMVEGEWRNNYVERKNLERVRERRKEMTYLR